MERKVLTLISCMHADIHAIVKNSKVKNDCVVINQCDENKEFEFDYEGHKIYAVHTKERGLSKSRNMALRKANQFDYDIYLIADDDLVYCDDYHDSIINAYKRQETANIIAFGMNKLNDNNVLKEMIKLGERKDPLVLVKRKQKYYSSVRISIKSSFAKENDLKFDENFGTGSQLYTHGEDSLFLKNCRLYTKEIYESKSIIVNVDYSDSTWRNVDFLKICYDKGALWRKLSPKMYPMYGIILIRGMLKRDEGTFFKSYKEYLKGARELNEVLEDTKKYPY